MKRVQGHRHSIYAAAFSILSVYILVATLFAVRTIEFARMMATQTTYGSYLTEAFWSFPKTLTGMW